MGYLLLFGAALFVWWLVTRKPGAALAAPTAPQDPRMVLTRRLDQNDVGTWETTFDHDGVLHIVLVSFESMTMVHSGEPGPGSNAITPTIEYDLRRTSDGKWEHRMSQRTFDAIAETSAEVSERAVAVAAADPTPENLRKSENALRSLKGWLESTPEWEPVGRFEPRIETAYLRYIHAR